MSEKEFLDQQQWLHVLPDRLTAKTSCELRVELAVVEEMVRHGESLLHQLGTLHGHALSHPGQGWEDSTARLAALDFQLLQEPPGSHTSPNAFRYLLERCPDFRG